MQGNALDVLRSMESESVQCVVTSPPYYGLRSYKTEPQLWDGDENCDHVWGEKLPFSKQDTRSAEKKREQGAAVGGSITFNDVTTTGNSGSFCQKCGSWRGELGLEPDFRLYISHLIQIFHEAKRVLKSDGCCFVNLGDSYAGSNGNGYKQTIANANQSNGLDINQDFRRMHKRDDGDVRPKSLMNIPGRFAIAMTDELQMIQRNELIWFKRACMPSSAKDRWTVDFEPVYFFTKNAKYKFNQQLEPIKQVSLDRVQYGWKSDHDSIGHIDVEAMGSRFANPDGRNARTLLDVPFEPQSNSHYASYPTKLAERFILAGSDEGDVVLDIFNGTASTGVAALRNRRKYLGIELQPEYIEISNQRLKEVQVKLF